MRTLLVPLKNIAVRCGFQELIERQGASMNRPCITQRGLVLLLVVSTLCPVLYADFTFGEPVNLRTIIPVLDPARDFINCLSYDGLEMYIHSGQDHDTNLRVLRRESKDADWGPPQDLGPIVNTADDSGPSISADGLTLYFNSNRPGGYGSWDIYMSKRTTKNDPWGPPVNLGAKVNSPFSEAWPWISMDGLELHFHSCRSGGYGCADIWVTRRATQDEPWGEAVNLGSVVNGAYEDAGPCISPDGRLLLLSSDRTSGYGSSDNWMSRRANVSDPWQTPVNLGPRVNTPQYNDLARFSPDGRQMFFTDGVIEDPTTWNNYQAAILPIVDFNGDKSVDVNDLRELVENWGMDNSLYDIGPYAWGDGKVDIEDLKVFVARWEQENAANSGDRQ